jgi:uncharacterized membrane protein (DUF373 family)
MNATDEPRIRIGRRREATLPIAALGWAEDLVHYAVALLLVAIAGVVLYRTVSDSLTGEHSFPVRITGVVNGVLFVIIIMEILRTVVAHFEREGFQLKPFLIIGIISAVRHILTVGAQTSLGADNRTDTAFNHSQIELGVNAAVVLLLVIGLVLVRRSDADGKEE